MLKVRGPLQTHTFHANFPGRNRTQPGLMGSLEVACPEQDKTQQLFFSMSQQLPGLSKGSVCRMAGPT